VQSKNYVSIHLKLIINSTFPSTEANCEAVCATKKGVCPQIEETDTFVSIVRKNLHAFV